MVEYLQAQAWPKPLGEGSDDPHSGPAPSGSHGPISGGCFRAHGFGGIQRCSLANLYSPAIFQLAGKVWEKGRERWACVCQLVLPEVIGMVLL